MPEKIAVELGNVQKTLLLPLWGRAVETQKPRPLLVDKAAAAIIDRIDFDFSAMAKNISTMTQVAWIMRSLYVDAAIKKFSEKYPLATMVNIGCGLDTTFERVDNGSFYWYDLDLPDVIQLRRNFIRESERRKFVACSFLDDKWSQELMVVENVLFMAAGVFYYFEEYQIRELFKKIADLFPCSEVVFDASSPIGVRVANKVVIKSSGMDEGSFLRWGLKSVREIESWDDRIKILDECPMFKNLRRELPFRNRLGPFISDALKIQYMVHLRFAKSGTL